MQKQVNLFKEEIIRYSNLTEIFQGWNAHAKWGTTYKQRRRILKEIQKAKKIFVEKRKNEPRSFLGT